MGETLTKNPCMYKHGNKEKIIIGKCFFALQEKTQSSQTWSTR